MAFFPPTKYDFPNVSNYDGDLRELIQYVRELQQTYDGLVDEMERLASMYDGLNAEFATVKTAFANLSRQFTALETYARGLETRIDANAAGIAENANDINVVRGLVMDVANNLHDAIADFNELVADFLQYANTYSDTLAEELRIDYNAKVADLQSQIDALQWELPDVYNIVKGTTTDLLTLVYDVYDACRNEAITAAEFDTLGLTATEFDNKQLTAFEFDTLSRTLLKGNKCRNPVTGELDNVCDILADIAQLTTTQNITATEFDAAELTADEFNALNLTAYMYDYYAKQFIAA